jgi:hypothetical protein
MHLQELSDLFTAKLDELKKDDPQKYLAFVAGLSSAVAALNKDIKEVNQLLKP